MFKEKLLQWFQDNGYDPEKLLQDKTKYEAAYMSDAASAVKKAAETGRHIFVVADYDVDGIMSGSILKKVLDDIKADYTIRFPRRISEGYGLSEQILKEVPDGALLVTIDNGISAAEVVESAKDRGIETVILDHHQPRGDGVLPDALVLVDPHAKNLDGEQWFQHYCGAGLGFMLARELHCSKPVLFQAITMAAMATIQDSVPLIGANRLIVKTGLEVLNKRSVRGIEGLYALCDMLNLQFGQITETQVAFQIGPCLNALGRLEDDGADVCYKALLYGGENPQDGIRRIVEANGIRKQLTAEQQVVLEDAAYQHPEYEHCVVVYAPNLHEGILGINAAKLTEKFGVPAIVLTDSEEEGILKGSARSVPGVDIKGLLDENVDLLVKHGGHAAAAGLSIQKANLEQFRQRMDVSAAKATPEKAGSAWKFDLKCDVEEADEAYQTIREYGPYGEGFPAPVLMFESFQMQPKYGKLFRYIGTNGVCFNSKDISAVGFGLQEKHLAEKSPTTVDILGYLERSSYDGKIQVVMSDFRPAPCPPRRKKNPFAREKYLI